jgi:hypothetical protein
MKPSCAIALVSSMLGRPFSVFSALDIASFFDEHATRKSVALTVANPKEILFIVFILGSRHAHSQAKAVYKHRAAP